MKVLAIDASTTSTGIAIFQDMKLIHYENITCSHNIYTRIMSMRDGILAIFKKYQPTNVIIQDVLPEEVNNNQNTFKALMYLQAAIVIALYEEFKFQNVQFYTASHWRRLCGIKNGRGIKRDSLKKASIQLVKNEYGLTVNDDVSDAICIGLAYIKQNGSAF